MEVIDEIIIAISQLRLLGVIFLTIVSGAVIYDRTAWSRVKNQ